MRIQMWLPCSVILLAAILLSGCQFHAFATPTPLPGWRSPVYKLLLDETSFPGDWQLGYDVPEYAKGSTTNHVTREWWHPSHSGIINQSIWRAYTVRAAQDKYDELVETQYAPSRAIPSGMVFVDFTQPSEIRFQSEEADQFHLACGWWGKAYCLTVARYRNYVVFLRIDHLAELMGQPSSGMTFQEIENLNQEMDAIFIQFLSQ
jgi:hypothetical protein